MATEKTAELKSASGLAKAGFVCGILALCLFWLFGIGQILAVLSHIFSGIAFARKERLGKAGLVLGIVSWVPLIIYGIWIGSLISSATANYGY